MERQIREIMNAKGNTDPIGRLETLYKSFHLLERQKAFMNVIWEMAKHGGSKEKRLSLALVGHLHLASEYKEKIKECLDEYKYGSDRLALIELLDLCGSLDDSWAIEFIKLIMMKSKTKNDWEIYILAIRISVATSEWRHAIQDLCENISSLDDEVVVDLFAYIHWVHPSELINRLTSEFNPKVGKKIFLLNDEIRKRYEEIYAHFSYQPEN
ncbi:hypothetical protein [Leptospira wolffii]|uniref:hypothetical protein n=1 Tax=Leptospira wolffii TaxID=409998 RepID=UPI00058F2133|nr:hypothetical protein [Leptospira wolffii]